MTSSHCGSYYLATPILGCRRYLGLTIHPNIRHGTLWADGMGLRCLCHRGHVKYEWLKGDQIIIIVFRHHHQILVSAFHNNVGPIVIATFIITIVMDY